MGIINAANKRVKELQKDYEGKNNLYTQHTQEQSELTEKDKALIERFNNGKMTVLDQSGNTLGSINQSDLVKPISQTQQRAHR